MSPRTSTRADGPLATPLYEKRFGANLGTARIELKDSYFRITGSLDTSVSGRWASPRSASTMLSTSLEGQLLLNGSFDSAFGTSTGDRNLFRKSLGIASVGGFPLTLDLEVTAKCDLSASRQSVRRPTRTSIRRPR